MKQIKLFTSILLIAGLSTIFASGQELVVPIVNGITLLGGAENGRWLTAEKTAAQLAVKTEFNVISFSGVDKGGAIFGMKGERQGACPENPVINLEETESDSPDEYLRFALGANAGWNPFPRFPQAVGLTTYTRSIKEFLATKGLAKTKIVITQAYKIDLEGDGDNEIIIAGNYYKRGMTEEQSAGDYSFLLLRKIVNGKPRDILIEGEFFTRRLLDSGEYDPPVSRRISAIADLNGDGRMEFVLSADYYEGDHTSVFEMESGKAVKALESDCSL
jgi:hypothetical protein